MTKKLAVFMNREDFREYENMKEVVSKLTNALEEQISKKKIDAKFTIDIYKTCPANYLAPIFLCTTNYLINEEKKEIAVELQKSLNQDESLLKNLAVEIQSLNTKNEKLKHQLDSIPNWIKSLFK